MHKILFALLFLNLLGCGKHESESKGKNTQIIRLNDVSAYAITPDGRIWYMQLDKADVVQMDSIHSIEENEISRRRQAEHDRIYQQNQNNLEHSYQPPMSHADSVELDKSAIEMLESLSKEGKKRREKDSIARLNN